MGSCHQVCPATSDIMAPSQVLPVRAEPKIQTMFPGSVPFP